MMNNGLLIIVPAMNGGGAERVITTIANYVVKDERPVTVVLTKSNRVDYELNKKINVIVNNKNTSVIGQICFIRKQIKQNKDKTVLSFFTYQNMYTLLANTLLNSKIIVSERNDPRTTVSKKLYWIRNILYKRASAIVFQTEEAMEFFDNKIKNISTIIPNPISPNLPEAYFGERKEKLVAFSRLTKQKNIPMMLEAFSIVKREFPSYKLCIYGTGEEEDNLKRYAVTVGVQDGVEFCGFSNQIHKDILQATAFLSTSDYEGISNSMIEAMAIGLPCICTDCPVGGARTFIKSGKNGILVPVGHVKQFANEIIRMIRDKDLSKRVSYNAPNIRKELEESNIVEKWIDVLF